MRRFRAGLLLADVTGFTALTERLQERGREGAEEVTALVRQRFRPMLGSIHRHGGIVATFGGDALFSVFPGAGGAARARRAAVAIAASIERHRELASSVGPVALGVTQAVHSGSVTAIHLGSAERRHFLVTGAAVHRLAALQEGAARGALHVSPIAMRERDPPAHPPSPAASVDDLVLAPYVPPRLRGLLRRHAGDSRDVAIVFLETAGDGVASLQRFFLELESALDSHGGVLLKSDLSRAGTKWLCVFGVPQAQEDDPDRAARMLLDLQHRLGKHIRFRAALHAGRVVCLQVGGAGRRALDVMGDAVNTAARALHPARWGELIVTEGCLQRLGSVVTRSRGAFPAKGKRDPMALHAIAGEGLGRGASPGTHAFVGRGDELAAIRRALDAACAGAGQAVAITGPAGIGKSRLAAEAARTARGRGAAVHVARATGLEPSPYRAVATLVSELLALRPGAPARAAARAIRKLELPALTMGHLLAVLGHPTVTGSPLATMDGRAVRRGNARAVAALAERIATSGPRVLILEELHRADGLTREVAAALAARASRSALLVILVHRDGYTPSDGVQTLALRELDLPGVEELLSAMVGPTSPSLRRFVAARASGNPMFLAELLGHLRVTGALVPGPNGLHLGSGAGRARVPETIERLLAARLDALPVAAREAARAAAVLGQSFPTWLLHAIRPAAARELPRLVRDGLLEELPDPRGEAHGFRHAMARQVAYDALLLAVRRQIHRAAAREIEARPTERDAHLGALAQHWEHAGEPARACPLYLAAAQRAQASHALEEAERLFRAHLALVGGESRAVADTRRELGVVLANQGKTPEAVAELGAAVEMGRRLGSWTSVGLTLNALGPVHLRRGDDDAARACFTESFELLEAAGRRAAAATSLSNLAGVAPSLPESLDLYGRALALQRALGDRVSEGITIGNMGRVEDALGHVDAAIDLFAAALAIHRETGNRRSEAVTLCNIGIGHTRRGALPPARSAFQDAAAVCRELGDRPLEAIVLGNLGPVLAKLGDLDGAGRVLEEALEIHRDVENRAYASTVLQALGELRILQRRLDDARLLLEEAARHPRTGVDGVLAVSLSFARSRLERLAGDLDSAALHAFEARRMAAEVSTPDALALAAVAEAHLALARGHEAGDLLVQARRHGESSADEEIAEIVEGLARAVDRWRSGQSLTGGEVP